MNIFSEDLGFTQVMRYLDVSNTVLDRWINHNAFPKPAKFSQRKARIWSKTKIDAWAENFPLLSRKTNGMGWVYANSQSNTPFNKNSLGQRGTGVGQGSSYKDDKDGEKEFLPVLPGTKRCSETT